MKKLLTSLTAISCAMFSLNSFASGDLDEVYHLKLGHTGTPTHHYQTISNLFSEKVKEATDGHVIIDVYPSDQLGNQLESVEGVMYGTQDMVLTSDTVISNWVPDFAILNLPFLFKNNKEYQYVIQGDVGDKLNAKLEPLGATVIGWWENGMRSITNSKKEIKSPADLKGMKIRVPEGEIFVDTFKALGAGPTVIPFGELYTALQLHTVDGQENPPAHILTQKFYEVQKYVTRTNHIHLSSPLIINTNLLNSLPEEYKDDLVSIAKELGPVHTKMVDDLEKEQWKQVAANGMKITDVDTTPFKKAVEPVIEKFKEKLDGDLINEIETKLKNR